MKFSPFFPIFPLKLNQPWGTLDPKDYSQFGFTRHNGIDVAIAPDKLVRAPFDGTIVKNGFQPNGGGIFCGFISDDEFDFDAFDCVTPDGLSIHFPALTSRVLFDFLHLQEIKAVEGQHYKAGDILAIPDNTGFSTGPHTHIQPRRVSWNGITVTALDTNDANNSFDPTQFWNGFPASHAQATLSNLSTQVSLLQKVVALLKQIFNK